MRYAKITDDVTGSVFGPYPSTQVARRLRGRFRGEGDETLGMCDEMTERWMAGEDATDLEDALGMHVDDCDDVHWGHELHAARETLGLTKGHLVRLVGASRTNLVTMWEERDDLPVPSYIWDVVEDLLGRQDDAMEAALGVVEDSGANSVELPYWDGKEDYDAHHHVDDDGRYEMANATNRRLAAVLWDRGVDVTWVSGADNPVPRM